MPLGVRGVEAPGVVGFAPGFPPPGPNQEDVTFADLHVLRLGSILQVVGSDPVIDRKRIASFISGDVEQNPAPDHLDDACRIALLGTQRLWWRQVVVESILAVDVTEGVKVRTGMVVHEGEAGGALLALGVVLPGLRRDAVVSVILLDNLNADARRGYHSGDIGSQLLAQRIHLALFDQSGGLNDHFGRDVVEHPALVVLAPATPVAVLAPFAWDGPRCRLVGQLVIQRIARALLGTG